MAKKNELLNGTFRIMRKLQKSLIGEKTDQSVCALGSLQIMISHEMEKGKTTIDKPLLADEENDKNKV